jgi:1-deoxy-D-xylulose-5-phosphate reductoisomerase
VQSVKKVSIFGVTGSVGQSTVDLILSNPEKFDVQVVTAGSNVLKLAEMAKKLNAKHAVIANENAYQELKSALAGTDIEISAGKQSIAQSASISADWIMCAIVGIAGLPSLMEAIKQGTSVAIANKEPLVAAGPMVMEDCKKFGTTILPVDSEHNAIFQVFDKSREMAIKNIILTASGGPFRGLSQDKMRDITPELAVKHPNWSMGAKISVDSATMMNKALEIIEAYYLFGMSADKINVLVHPQSIIHSMVEYIDGSILAQMGAPDMKTPIAHTLAWPDRMKTSGNTLDWKNLSQLTFEPVDHKAFPSINLAYQCLDAGLYACIIMNTANEVLVEQFLQGKIGFLDIVDTIARILEDYRKTNVTSLNDVIDLDSSVRKRILNYIN